MILPKPKKSPWRVRPSILRTIWRMKLLGSMLCFAIMVWSGEVTVRGPAKPVAVMGGLVAGWDADVVYGLGHPLSLFSHPSVMFRSGLKF